MPKTATIYACAKCDAQSPKWLGQCAECGGWGTMQVHAASPAAARAASGIVLPDIPSLHTMDATQTKHIPTGISEFDLAVGGGLIPGALLLLAGEPGIGKSTLIMQVAGAVAGQATPVLYISGEETAPQLKQRADRLNVRSEHIKVLTTNDAAVATAAIAKLRPALAIVDSIQTIALPDIPTGTGGVTQVRAVTNAILHTAKTTNVPTIIIGHVTKDGTVAGPKTLEHLVDQVAVFEGDPHGDLRVLRTTKNRYGSTDVAGVFTMTERGLDACADPASAFLTAGTPSPGSAIAAAGLGNRTILVEVQALVTKSSFGQPQRRSVGIDINRLHVILAILAQHGGVSFASSDVHVATASGIRIDDPACDLALAGALLSASADAPLPLDALVGELGLSGTVRAARGVTKRVAEAARMGRKRIAAPAGIAAPRGATLTTIATIRDLASLALPHQLRRHSVSP
ncbi:MAG: DNA repair protein RadA [bacterium]|nr:DNA repair protein RadA [bacterium]